MKKLFVLLIIPALFLLNSCKKETTPEPEPEPEPTPAPANTCPPSSCTEPASVWNITGTGPHLIFKFKFDSTQARLTSTGGLATIPSTNAAVSPVFNRMSAHYIEMAQTDFTQVGAGTVLYRAAETTCDGANAITFCQSVVAKQDSVFFSVPISSVTPGTYKWLRISLAYQNYDIPFKTSFCSGTQWGTVASFLGFKTYVTQYKIKNQLVVPTESLAITPNSSPGGNYLQGYWAFETNACANPSPWRTDGNAATTTVVNPNPSSPIPAGSCLVTGEFNTGGSNIPLIITGNETSDIIITVSLSTNKSFEWKETTFDGYYEPGAMEYPVDMGIRGMIPKY
jgi:hypothetical protein